MADMAGEWDERRIERELAPGRTWLVRDSGGVRRVLKRLPDDCLRAGQLHPSIKLRLTRLRELPLGCFVNLIGVERDPQCGVVLVSDYIDGVPLESLPLVERVRLHRELEQAVEAMHQLGMVHGAIHGQNVIVDGWGKLWLIDPSPLLHDDPAVDRRAVERLAVVDAAARAEAGADGRADDLSRQRTLLAAVAIVVLAVVAAVGIRYFVMVE